MSHTLDPSLAGTCKPPSIDAYLDLSGTYGPPEVTAARAVYNIGGGAPHVVADRLPSTFGLRRECCRFPEQAVWADDDELAIVVSAGEATEGHMQVVGSRTTLELWASEDGYQERLDELAPVAVAA